jgi:hypothetical protein
LQHNAINAHKAHLPYLGVAGYMFQKPPEIQRLSGAAWQGLLPPKMGDQDA